jgi:hypothetical protein
VHGIAALQREMRADGELLLRVDCAPHRGAPPQVVRKSAQVLAQALPLHLLACACAREPRPDGWARELSQGRLTSGAAATAARALLRAGCAGCACTLTALARRAAPRSRPAGAPAARLRAAAAPAGTGSLQEAAAPGGGAAQVRRSRRARAAAGGAARGCAR